jgi:hypothetical protein
VKTSAGDEINDECEDRGRSRIKEKNYIREGVTSGREL